MMKTNLHMHKATEFLILALLAIAPCAAKAQITDNVYIPASSADDNTILITEELSSCSRIGVTKTKKWTPEVPVPPYGDINGDGFLDAQDDGEHKYEADANFIEVRTVIAKEASSNAHSWAIDAFRSSVFFDDKDNYGVWCFNYHKDGSDSEFDYNNRNCYFIETWRSYANDGSDHVAKDANGFVTQVKTGEGLAYLAKHVNKGIIKLTENTSYLGKNIIQTKDIELFPHYWEPIGWADFANGVCGQYGSGKFCTFAGSYDGQGHIIENAKSILPVEYMGLFGATGMPMINGDDYEKLKDGDVDSLYATNGLRRVEGSKIQRTFVINHDFTLTAFSNVAAMGGIVGHCETGALDRCEATGMLSVYHQSAYNQHAVGGLAGTFVDSESNGVTVDGVSLYDNSASSGSITNSFSVNAFTLMFNPDGGLSDYGGLCSRARKASIKNCYVKTHFENKTTSQNFAYGALLTGRLSEDTEVANCYIIHSDVDTWIVYNPYADITIKSCYAPLPGEDAPFVEYWVNYGNGNQQTIGTKTEGNGNYYYSPTIGADQLGYMYADNIIVDEDGDPVSYTSGGATITGPLFEALNTYVDNDNSDLELDHWARPALAYYDTDYDESVDPPIPFTYVEKPINGDLPVLLMDNYDEEEGIVGAGGFRSVSTKKRNWKKKSSSYDDPGYVLQYSGPRRDAWHFDNDPYFYAEIDGMLDRSIGLDSHFIYGDMVEAPSIVYSTSGDDGTWDANRISIYEHAAILATGTLSSFDKTHVSITFDNSAAEAGIGAVSTDGMNQLGETELPRDWHLLSTPLAKAPIGFNYMTNNGTVNTNDAGGWSSGNTGDYANNPWVGGTEFGWLGGGVNRYWMTGWAGSQSNIGGGYTDINFETEDKNTWTDGYFPSTFVSGLPSISDPSKPHTFGFGCINDEVGKYPYGMDFYSWSEPNYHYINFKRNGPNHWHSDEPHAHLSYTPETTTNNPGTFATNVNETFLLSGKGYFASIAEKTLLQSSGTLNDSNIYEQPISPDPGAVTPSSGQIDIAVTYSKNPLGLMEGWNLIGNPFHAYLDFSEFYYVNTNWGEEENIANEYVVYNADGYGSDGQYDYGNGFSYYVVGSSLHGAYASPYLHPHQAFFVKANNDATLSFTSGQFTTRYNLQTDCNFRGDNRPAYPLVNLFLSSDKGCSDVCVVEFNRPEWGGGTKMREMRSGNGLLYAYHDEKNYAALFATEEAKRIPLRFEAKERGGDTYTIRWNTANGDFAKLILVDNIAGVQYDMLANDRYSFHGSPDDYWSRFYITFDVTGLDDDDDNDDETPTGSTTFAFFDGSQWIVTNDSHGTAQLDLVDLQGRVLTTATVDNGQAHLSLPNVASGMYLMRMTGQNGTKVQKIIVR